MQRNVQTAIFPVAGKGTRMLPATRAIPKELLPVLDRPLLDFAMDEAFRAGIQRLIFVTHPDKPSIEHHVRQSLDNLERSPDIEIIFTSQDEQLGLGHAVLQARDLVLPGAVAVLLPDDLILAGPGCLGEMVDAYRNLETGHLVATMQVPPELTDRYGILSVTETRGQIAIANSVIEKPDPFEAPSNDAVIGRYILDPSIFAALMTQRPGAGGEVQLTDAIAATSERVGLAGFRFLGKRFDCGSKEGLLAATLHQAEKDPDYHHLLGSPSAHAIVAAA
ncbi:MAG: sugar phosphate nucleotidyltransferase [Boseongicola sp.]|nr:sugar phosphate nucleotidyltransferase [Boseongicola sp.]MDD9979472.1 sugar phosphate nucleotidyltransferase [Boseongicola sp.]